LLRLYSKRYLWVANDTFALTCVTEIRDVVMQFKSNTIEVSKESPYKYDCLSRKEHVDNLSSLLQNISSPIVLSINASWGQGKTTFIRMLNIELINQGHQTVLTT
jgi:hypothetical protein